MFLREGPAHPPAAMGPPGTPLSPAAGMHRPSQCKEGDFLGTAGCKGHCCPLLVQGQGERGQPSSHPGAWHPGWWGTLLSLAVTCALNAPVLSQAATASASSCACCSIPLASKEPFWSQVRVVSHVRLSLRATAAD